MEDNINSKISEILSSPDLMSNIQSIVSSLGNGDKEDKTNEEKNSSEAITDIVQAVTQNGLMGSIGKFLTENQNERIAFLTALRPFLSEEKRETLDFIIQILKAVNVFLSVNMFS